MEIEFPQDFFEPIKKIVSDADPLITSAYIEGVDNIYCLEKYMLRDKSTKLNVLIDNNIFTRIVHLSKGNSVPIHEEKIYRYCCAVMCFFILGDFNIEPNLSLYERASKNNHSNALDDLYYFRVADHFHPIDYAQLALGYQSCFSKIGIENAKKLMAGNLQEIDESNFCKLLDDWKLTYLHLLKIFEVLKYNIEETQRIKIFFDWVASDCVVSPGAIVFALLFFSPRRSSLPTMIKNVNSLDHEKIKSGLKNAAWDLTYVASFRKKSKFQPENTIWFFCSNDDLLKKIFRILYVKPGENPDSAIKKLINDFWGISKGVEVYQFYRNMGMAIHSDRDSRIKRNKEFKLKIDKIVEEFESKIFSNNSY